MTQITIYDELKNVEKTSKRLVKRDLNTIHYEVLDYLKKHALGSKNKVSGHDLMLQFGLESTAQVRNIIKKLRTSPTIDVVIGSDKMGYFIPFMSEYKEAVQYKINKAKSEMITAIKMYPEAVKEFHAILGNAYNESNKAPQGQMQIKFNGWEKDINYFADKYVKGVIK